MKSGRFRVATVLLLVISACFVTVPLAGATDSGTVILPWVPNGDNTGGLGPWYGRIEIQNPSSTLCSIKIAVPETNGTWNTNTQFIISPHGLSDLSPDDIGLAAPGGAVKIDSGGCKAAVSVKQASTTFGDPPWSNGARAITGYTGIPGEDTVNNAQWILPIVQTNNGWDSYIRVTNVEQFNTKNVTIQIFPYHNLSADSGSVFSETIALAAGSTHTLDVLDALDQTGFVGFARITSVGNVVAMVQREKPGSEVAMINVASAQPTEAASVQSATSYTLQAPIIFNAYNGWNTGINLANPTGSVANVTVSYPGAGRPDDNVTLQPFSSDYVYTAANASGQTGFTGNAVIYSDQPIGAIVDEVKYSTNDGISYSAVPGLDSQVALPLIFKQAQSGTRNDNSGINVSNASDNQTTVEINIYNQDGGLAGGPYDLTIPAHSSNFIYLPTTAVAPDTLGTAVVRSLDGAPIVAVSNDVSYDVAGGGSAVFNAPSGLGLYQISAGDAP